ncbi:hypothetical protein CISIN_1g030650mg [Citrus sinensis]|uniref:Uncharacterized protein n=1 Tax=Citrus sinensis TaxID=2711 RepID=A0A067D539_CITSI|nr:hypothetical protein CISIN_1g030650mg [Citrus sinensis]
MVVAISEENPRTRKPKGRFVSSRYLSPSPSSSSSLTTATTTAKSQSQSQRFSSLLVSRSINSSNLPALGTKRSQSVDRRRQLSTITRMLITSTRSLSVSFQGETFSLPISKTKAKATPETRRGTPVRDQPWPGRTQQGNPICQGCWILVLRRRLNSMRTPPRTRTKEELKEAYI